MQLHNILILGYITFFTEKISQRKQQRRFGNQPKNMNAIEDFCERFDRAVKNTLDQVLYKTGF